MTDADLTLRDEVAEVLLPTLQRDHKCGLHAGPGSGVCRSCRRRAGLCADALLPLLARVREEHCEEVDDQALLVAEKRGYAIGRAEVEARVEAAWPDPFGEFTATEAAAAKLMKDAIRAALAEPQQPRPDSLATQPADRCLTCGPGYHYGGDGCRHKPAPEAATVEGAHGGHSGPEMAPERPDAPSGVSVDPDEDGRAL